LEEFQYVFVELKTLPSIRKLDHKIPLMPGAKLVNIRPYEVLSFIKRTYKI
jgi:hypothetical protein